MAVAGNWKFEGVELTNASVKFHPTSGTISQQMRQSFEDLHDGTQSREMVGRDLPSVQMEFSFMGRGSDKYDRLRIFTDVLDSDEVWTLEAPEEVPVFLYKNHKRAALSTRSWTHDQDKATGKITIRVDAAINGVWVADGGDYCEPVTGHFTAAGVTETPDVAVSENHGRLRGIVKPNLVASPLGSGFSNAFRFDGVDRGLLSSRIIAGAPTMPSGAFSLQIRGFKYMATPEVRGYIAGFGINSEDSTYCYLTVNDADVIEFWVKGSTGSRLGGAPTAPLTVGGTYALELNWNGSSLSLFINGNLTSITSFGSGAIGTFTNAGEKGFSIGGADSLAASTVYPVSAFIDEVRWSKVSRHSLSYTPETSPYVADSDTLHLYHLDTTDSSIASYTLGDDDACDISDTAVRTRVEEDASGVDSAGGNHLAVIGSPTFVTASETFAKFGGGFLYPTTSDFHTVSASGPYITGDLTVMAAFKITSSVFATKCIVNAYDTTDDSVAYRIVLTPNGTSDGFWVNFNHQDSSGAGISSTFSGITLAVGDEVVLFVQRNTVSNQVTLWLNGISYNMGTYLTEADAAANPVIRVGNNETGSFGFDCELYELRIWNQMLSPTTIASLSNLNDETYRSRIVGNEVAAYFFATVRNGYGAAGSPLLELPAQTDGYPLAVRESDYQRAVPTLHSTVNRPNILGTANLAHEIYDMTGFIVPTPDEPCEAGLFEVCSSPTDDFLSGVGVAIAVEAEPLDRWLLSGAVLG